MTWNIYATLNSQCEGKVNRTDKNDEILPFAYIDLGDMMSLESNKAVVLKESGLGLNQDPIQKVNRGDKSTIKFINIDKVKWIKDKSAKKDCICRQDTHIATIFGCNKVGYWEKGHIIVT